MFGVSTFYEPQRCCFRYDNSSIVPALLLQILPVPVVPSAVHTTLLPSVRLVRLSLPPSVTVWFAHPVAYFYCPYPSDFVPIFPLVLDFALARLAGLLAQDLSSLWLVLPALLLPVTALVVVRLTVPILLTVP